MCRDGMDQFGPEYKHSKSINVCTMYILNFLVAIIFTFLFPKGSDMYFPPIGLTSGVLYLVTISPVYSSLNIVLVNLTRNTMCKSTQIYLI